MYGLKTLRLNPERDRPPSVSWIDRRTLLTASICRMTELQSFNLHCIPVSISTEIGSTSQPRARANDGFSVGRTGHWQCQIHNIRSRWSSTRYSLFNPHSPLQLSLTDTFFQPADYGEIIFLRFLALSSLLTLKTTNVSPSRKRNSMPYCPWKTCKRFPL
jgi:hypothetical protein